MLSRPLAYQGRLALVTGASSGIGEAFARELAARGADLVVCGRDSARLNAVAAEIKAAYDVRVTAHPLDLAERGAAERLHSLVLAAGVTPSVLVNNAGLGVLGGFRTAPLAVQLEMIRVNVEALVALTGLFVPAMAARREGAVINVASAAAFQPLPNFAVYAASKAFVVSFSEALWQECRGSGLRVLAVCPGPVSDTRFGRGATGSAVRFRHLRDTPRERVVADALGALDRGERVVVPGLTNRLVAFATGLAPRRLQLLVAEWLFRA
ncbi:MAG: SDR family oxidoreductase [Chloroflexota bacterium]